MGQEDNIELLSFIEKKKQEAIKSGSDVLDERGKGYYGGIESAMSDLQRFIRELQKKAEEDGRKKKISFSPRQLFSNHFDARDYLSIEMRDDDMAQRCEEYDMSPGAVYELAKHFCVSLNAYDLPDKVELWVDLDD